MDKKIQQHQEELRRKEEQKKLQEQNRLQEQESIELTELETIEERLLFDPNSQQTENHHILSPQKSSLPTENHHISPPQTFTRRNEVFADGR